MVTDSRADCETRTRLDYSCFGTQSLGLLSLRLSFYPSAGLLDQFAEASANTQFHSIEWDQLDHPLLEPRAPAQCSCFDAGRWVGADLSFVKRDFAESTS